MKEFTTKIEPSGRRGKDCLSLRREVSAFGASLLLRAFIVITSE